MQYRHMTYTYRFRILPKDLQAHYTAEHERKRKLRRAAARRGREWEWKEAARKAAEAACVNPV